jgi:phospholipase/carboxylesterase
MLEENTRVINIEKWVFRVRIPDGDGQHPVMLLLHGWTGNENAMWVFTSRLPKDHILIAPRGIFTAPLGGYGWHEFKAKAWPWVDDLRPAIDSLIDLLSAENFPKADLEKISLVGFSQGAALSYTYALLHPDRVSAVAGLSGFLPDGVMPLIREHPLEDMPIFVTHGNQDELVPIERARKSVDLLEEAGAQVTYCEDDVGHKLSADCFQGMQNFFASLHKKHEY